MSDLRLLHGHASESVLDNEFLCESASGIFILRSTLKDKIKEDGNLCLDTGSC